jgi:hypothetical protein
MTTQISSLTILEELIETSEKSTILTLISEEATELRSTTSLLLFKLLCGPMVALLGSEATEDSSTSLSCDALPVGTEPLIPAKIEHHSSSLGICFGHTWRGVFDW